MHRFTIVGLVALSLIANTESLSQQPQQNPCTFRDPVNTRSYNLTPLVSSTEDYVLRNDITNDTVRFQLCHDLHEDCNDAGGYSVCLERGGKHVMIGKYPPIMNGVNGSIMFRFDGDECQNDTKYSMTVIMLCDYSGKDEKPVLFPYDKNTCNMHISWNSKLACGSPPKSVDCTVINADGDLVDLSSLTSQINNYVIPNRDKSFIVLNVCHSVIPEYGAVCPVNSGICLRNESSPIATYLNLGDVESPRLINGTVALHYEGGGICDDGEHVTATIFFICDFKSRRNVPEVTKSSGCNYELSWKNIAACSDKQLEEYSRRTSSPCKVSNPITSAQYDLKSLQGQDYIIESSNGSYKMSVCGSLATKTCESNAGVCRSQNFTTEGLANSDLQWSPAGPYLNYTNGSICEENKQHYTIISFICSSEDEKNKPTIVNHEKCFLKVHFPTPLACETEENKRDLPGTPSSSNNSNNSIPSTVPSVTPHPTVPPTTINSTTDDALPQKKSGDDGNTNSSHGGLIAFLVIFIAFGLICGIYFANPVRRSNFYTFCSSIVLRRSPTAMNYSQEL